MTGLRKTLAGLMAVVIIPVTALQGVDTVLCIAKDGHMALEMAINGQCVSGPFVPMKTPETSLPTLADSPSESHCGLCLDVPVHASVAIQSARSSSEQKSIPVPAGKMFSNYCTGVSCLAMNLGSCTFTRPASAPLSLPSSRTIVLRN